MERKEGKRERKMRGWKDGREERKRVEIKRNTICSKEKWIEEGRNKIGKDGRKVRKQGRKRWKSVKKKKICSIILPQHRDHLFHSSWIKNSIVALWSIMSSQRKLTVRGRRWQRCTAAT